MNFVSRFLTKSVLFLFGDLISFENGQYITDSPDKVIFAFNHNSSYETVLVDAFLHYMRNGRSIGFLIDWMYGYAPGFGWFIRQSEPIFVYTKPAVFGFMKRKKKRLHIKNVLEASLDKLNENKAIALFPEGKRNRDPYKLKRARHGLATIALEADASIIPIGIDFPQRIKKGKIPKFGRIIFRIGQPLSFHEESVQYMKAKASQKLSKDQKNKYLNTLYNTLTDTVMLHIAELCGKKYPFSRPS